MGHMSRTFCWEHVGTKCWSSLLRKYGASAIDVKHVCPSKPSTIKDGFSDLFYAATWQVVNIKEEEGKYGLDLRILAFEHFGQRFQRCFFLMGNTGHLSHPSGRGADPCDEVT